MYPIRVLKPFTFDLSRVLTPISPDAPSGESLRYEGVYDQIREARAEDDPVLSRGVWKIPLKRAEWPEVEALCIDALEHRTKDLQISAWLLEAWIQIYGFAGLREGLRLLFALCEKFWDTLHPQVKDGDLEFRIAPLVWINDKLPVRLKLLAVTNPPSDDVKAYCFADWESACRPPAAAQAKDGATQAQFDQSALLTPTNFFSGLLTDINGAMQAAEDLETFLERQCGPGAPSLRQLWTTIDSIRGLIVSILNQRETPAAALPSNPEQTGGGAGHYDEAIQPTDSGPELTVVASNGPIRSRSEAYRRLSEAADYLARTEPHSPTPYLVRRAIAWGGMRLEELLQELVHNNSELGEIFRLLQMQPPPKK
jgi:type VI secretion system ImpA family protein